MRHCCICLAASGSINWGRSGVKIGVVSTLTIEIIVVIIFILGYNNIDLKFSLDFKNERVSYMNLAKISANGQITVPVEIRRLLGLKSGDKILFYQKQDGEVVVSNASAQAIRRAQAAFADVADAMGVSSEDDVQTLVNEVRYGKG